MILPTPAMELQRVFEFISNAKWSQLKEIAVALDNAGYVPEQGCLPSKTLVDVMKTEFLLKNWDLISLDDLELVVKDR